MLPDPTQTPTIDIAEAATLIGVGRSLAYESIRDGTWPTTVLRIGQKIRIPTAQVLALLSAPAPADSRPELLAEAERDLAAALNAALAALSDLTSKVATVRAFVTRA